MGKKLQKMPERNGIEGPKALPKKVDSDVVLDNQILPFIPESFQGSYQKVLQGELSPRQAIKVQCCHCCGWDRKAVRLCGDNTCPLHCYRPFQDEEVKK